MCGTKNPHKAPSGCDASQPRPRWQASGGSPPRRGLDEIGPSRAKEIFGGGAPKVSIWRGDFEVANLFSFFGPTFGAAA